ncbi:ATP-binding protein [Archangium sp.]|uniref:AlbA family DNA-binding domain-containing protein n=1 Tax=Archangium sp. TaxID=1872627 RepID=UPI002D33B175|nr:ATP-binding protein [Archangium sp.]HYO57779.1 ATP-binding protein [Archangium sp.]
MKTPKTIADLEALITTRVQESLHLDYKESDALSDKKRGEIAKDVSAFANSDGGVIVYGIVEANHLPVSIDNGVSDAQYNREWLENVITRETHGMVCGQRCHVLPAQGRAAG